MSWNNVYPEELFKKIVHRLTENKATPLLNGHHCWEYTARLNEKGYARLRHGGKDFYAHRVMLSLKLGRILEPHELAQHDCDNPKCSCPAHLSVGTIHSNNADRDNKGRRGKTTKTRHTPKEIAAQIKMALRLNHSTTNIINRYGCTSKTVRDIRAGRTFREI